MWVLYNSGRQYTGKERVTLANRVCLYECLHQTIPVSCVGVFPCSHSLAGAVQC